MFLVASCVLLFFSASCQRREGVSTFKQFPNPLRNSAVFFYEENLDYYPNRIIVGFARDADLPLRAELKDVPSPPSSPIIRNIGPARLARYIAKSAKLELSHEAYVGDSNFASFVCPSPAEAERLISELPRSLPEDIRFVEYDGKAWLAFVPNDPDYPDLMWGMQKINCEPAWDVAKGNGVKIGIIDTGIRFSGESPDHEDLSANVFLPSGLNLDLVNNDPIPEDTNGHGTHVAGTAAAVGNNAKGVVGVAFDAQIIPIKVISGDETFFPYSRLAQGIAAAQVAGCDVVNMSLGGTFLSKALHEAIQEAYSQGIVLVAAAGNNSNSKMFYPAAYPEVMAVGATESTDSRASFSNYGEWVDIAAPGNEIRSTLGWASNAYGNLSGTSMASPHVSGAAALLLELTPSLTPLEVFAILQASGDDLPDSEWQNADIKRLNVGNAVNYSLGAFPSVEITSPLGGEVSGVVDFSANASDSDGTISKVFFYAGSYFLGIDKTEPYSVSWDTSKFPNATYTLKAIAVDNEAQQSSDTVVVTTNNGQVAPNYFIDFESGADGWWVQDENGSSYWHLSEERSYSPTHSFKFGEPGGGLYGGYEHDLLFSPLIDLSNLTHAKIGYRYFRDLNLGDYAYVTVNTGEGEYYILKTYSDYGFDWEYDEVSLDSYLGKSIQVVFVVETDAYNHGSGFFVDDFFVRKASDPPLVELTEPTPGEVSGTIWVKAQASDDVQISKVEFYVDDVHKATVENPPYEFQLDTTYIHGGTRVIRAIAYDEYPLTAEDSVTVTVKNHEISSISPLSATAGTQLTIDGSMFIENGASSRDPLTDKVFFTGEEQLVEANVLSWQKARIRVLVPDDASDGPIYVDIYGASASSPADFIILPKIDRLDPNAAQVGSTVRVEGSGFFSQMSEESAVYFGEVSAQIVSWANRAIEVKVPAGIKPSSVTVTTKHGTSNDIFFIPVAKIDSLSRYRGHPGAQVTIFGSSFGDSKGFSEVYFAPDIQVPDENFVSWQDTQIILRVPGGAQSGAVYVLANGYESNRVDFTVTLPPPTLASLAQY